MCMGSKVMLPRAQSPFTLRNMVFTFNGMGHGLLQIEIGWGPRHPSATNNRLAMRQRLSFQLTTLVVGQRHLN